MGRAAALNAGFFAAKGDALPTVLAERSAWNLLVGVGSRLTTAPRVNQTGRVLDKVVDRLPHFVAHKLVALTLQASVSAGRRRADR